LSGRRATRKRELSAHESARLGAQLALAKKGEEIVILDLRGFEIGCDFFVIVSASSEPHVRAIADGILEGTAQQSGDHPWHIEGLTHGRWVLLDYVDWVVHVFHAQTRGYYMLERLWGDAPREVIQDPLAVSETDE